MSHLPRQGQYELFFYNSKIYCFDDPGAEWPETREMRSWLAIRQSDNCRVFPILTGSNRPAAYYLSPEMYTLWKLSWSEYAST